MNDENMLNFWYFVNHKPQGLWFQNQQQLQYVQEQTFRKYFKLRVDNKDSGSQFHQQGITLLLLTEQPEGLWLDFLYTGPTLLWIISMIIFMAHLGGCYLQIAEQEVGYLNYVYLTTPAIIFVYIYCITQPNFLEHILGLLITFYASIVIGCLFFGHKLLLELVEDTWLVPFLKQIQKLVNYLSVAFCLRMLLFIAISAQYITLSQFIILFDIIIGEVFPYIFLLCMKIQAPNNQNHNETEMRYMNEPLLS
ncbi:hypothetical protein pb186bvf_004360 [Paramecium bursaria]